MKSRYIFETHRKAPAPIGVGVVLFVVFHEVAGLTTEVFTKALDRPCVKVSLIPANLVNRCISYNFITLQAVCREALAFQ